MLTEIRMGLHKMVSHNNIENMIGLLMFVNGEIKEHLSKNMAVPPNQRHAEREYSESVPTNAIRVRPNRNIQRERKVSNL